MKVTYSEMIGQLLEKGYHYERQSALIADALGIVNGPVVESIRRWGDGKARPSGPWIKGLERVWTEKVGNVIELDERE